MSRDFGSLAYQPADPAQYRPRPAWVITAPPNVMMKLKRLFPRLAPRDNGEQAIVSTPEVCRDLADMVLNRWPMRISDADRLVLDEQADRHRQIEEDVESILRGDRGGFVGDHEPTLTPYREQEEVAQIVHTTGRLLCGDDVGYGKTFAALLTASKASALPAVVVAPAHLTRQWLAEANRCFPTMRTHLIRTSKLYDPSQRREMRGYQPDLYIVSYTMLHGWVDHLKSVIRLVIFEEAQELRHHGTRKHEAAVELAAHAELRLEITATPVYNYGAEAHTVVSAIDGDVLGSRLEFVREWCGGVDRGPKTRVTNSKALGRYLRDEGIYLARKRKKGPPQKIPQLLPTRDKELDRALDEVLELAMLIDSGQGSPTERRDAAGELDWRVRQATGIAKAPDVAAFAKMLLESEQKIVVWAWHRAVYDELLNRLASYNPILYTGSESAPQKQKAIERFLQPVERIVYEGHDPITDPHASRVLLMSLRSGAGVDGLQKVTNVGVFGELDWSPQVHDQCLGRIDPTRGMDPRLDATDVGSAIGYFLHVDHGSDPVVMDVLNLKRQQSEPIHDPNAPLFEMPGGGGAADDRMRRLAAAVIARRGGRRHRTAA